MRIKDFANVVIQKIKTLKPTDASLSNTKLVEEDQLTIREIEAMMASYKDDERLIDDEAMLQPFIQYLQSRFMRIELTDLNYHEHPKTLGNEASRILASQVIIAANQVHYQSRDLNQILTPKLPQTLSRLANLYLNVIEDIVKEVIWNRDLFIDIESYHALLELKAVLLKLQYDQSLVTLDSVKPILDVFAKRWEAIEDTDADYMVNDRSSANQLYHDLAKNIIRMLPGHSNSLNLSADHLLRPVIRAHKVNSDDAIKHFVFNLLKDEETMNEASKPITAILRSLKITEADFARLVLNQINQIQEKHVELSLEISAEGHARINKLRELCDQYQDSNKPVNHTMLSAYINFLRKRWREVNGTMAAYPVTRDTPANHACQFLADMISIMAYRLNSLNREQSYLLMTTNVEKLSEVDAKLKLQKTITSMATNREQLISTLTKLDYDHWNDYLKLFDTTQLIRLMSDGQDFAAILKNQAAYQGSDEENKAALYANFSIYESLRAGSANAHTSFFGGLSSYVVNVPDREAKLLAVKATKQLFASDLSLKEIARELQDVDHDYYQKHHVAFNDGKLKQLISHLNGVVAAQVENLESENKVGYGR